MVQLMYHNAREPNGSFTNPLPKHEIDKAATLHPVKEARYQYRLHQRMLARDSVRLRSQLRLLQRQVSKMDALIHVCICVKLNIKVRDVFNISSEQTVTKRWLRMNKLHVIEW
jgi:Chondroitin N-acetylgalactosaminyltransferase